MLKCLLTHQSDSTPLTSSVSSVFNSLHLCSPHSSFISHQTVSFSCCVSLFLFLFLSFQPDIIPPLYQRYPNNLLQVNVYATQAPQASFTSSGTAIQSWHHGYHFFFLTFAFFGKGCTISAVGNMEVDVIANGTAVNAFTLSGVANLAGAVSCVCFC